MKNFKQFTTPVLGSTLSFGVFMMVQRWRISSNSQPTRPSNRCFPRCLWWFKDEEFQAIHNWLHCVTSTITGVYDGSKMKNFKQFTTGGCHGGHVDGVFMMVQRWRISSNSQPSSLQYASNIGCLWWFKDEEFQAIHNIKQLQHHTNDGVYDGSKMKNFKQFTTSCCAC